MSTTKAYTVPDSIRHEESKTFYTDMIDEYREVTGRALNSAALSCMENAAILQDVIYDLKEDIRQRGVIELFQQGKQKIRRENKAVANLAKTCIEQQKLLKGIGLLKASAAGTEDSESGEDDDEFDEFD